jgi:cytoskeletal protein RodZ
LDSFAGVTGVSADALDKVFDRALAELPGDRFATAGDFAKALQAAVERKRSVAGRVGPTVRAPIPTPVVEPPSTPVTADELPLFTDSLLGEKADSAESMHEPERSSAVDHVIDDFHPERHDASNRRLSIDDFTEVVHDVSTRQNDDSLSAKPHAESPRETAPKRRDQDFNLDEVFAREAADVTSRPAPFESMDSAPGRSSSGVWPLMLALVVGIALGFGMAMLMLGRDRVALAPQQATVSTSGGRGAAEVRDEPIREVTEQTVATTPKPGAPGPTEPSAPASVARPGAPSPVKPTDSASRIDNLPPPQGRTPVDTAKTTPAPSKATVPPTKPVGSAAKPSGTATKAAATPAPGRGASKAVAATPAKPATQPPVKTATGSLVVESRPAGAAVFLDGRRVGTTPLVLDTLKVGDYTIGLDITGYKRWASTVKVTSGERSRVSASLEQ